MHNVHLYMIKYELLTDFIVGAPYDCEDGRGAVYVYHGSKDGVRTEPTQKIEARKVHADLKTFGFSLAGGHDIDKNQYPGILKCIHLFCLSCIDNLPYVRFFLC